MRGLADAVAAARTERRKRRSIKVQTPVNQTSLFPFKSIL